jgi:hypothetical protein
VSDRGRRLTLFLPVVVTVVLAGVIGALVIVQQQKQSDRVAAADAAAEAYLSDVGMFKGAVAREIRGARTAAPADLRRVLKTAVADPPRLAGAPSSGVTRSASYAAAQETEAGLLQPYRRLDRVLRKAAVARTFVAASRDALALRASDYVGSTAIDDSRRIRSELIPAFSAARDRLAAVPVPDGQERLAATVVDAVQYVIDQATTLAVSIEANHSFSFTYSEQFQAAAEAVDGYAAVVDGDVTEAIDTIVVGAP